MSLPSGLINAVANHIQAFDNEVDIARIETLSNPVTASEQHANALFKPVSFAVNSNANDARSSLLTALFTSKSKTIKLKGTVDATFKVPSLDTRPSLTSPSRTILSCRA
ncbi:hypothetical protein MVEG_10061 [Podila verticillata NRRL 6337]|nr:hypothetical protein MVEG_10061 [Podila verticillata NRRL 6337]